MTRATHALSALDAAGGSDAGLQRDVNEDRYFLDASRGVLIVVDGVGGQAAGGKAADIALATLKEGLGRESGTLERRIGEAITAANNEIHRNAALRREWQGMACVLTVVVVEDGRAVVGHVGDTRLYKIRGDGIQKVTRDHSPVGEREDQGEISETEAMSHPRRHEVYRDVGSDRHTADDEDFVDLYEIPFEPDAALLVCSDGLTDLVDSSVIRSVISELAGQPSAIVRRLIDLANDAGGKDNITVVYAEAEHFAPRPAASDGSDTTRRRTPPSTADDLVIRSAADGDEEDAADAGRISRAAIVGLLTFFVVAGIVASYPYWSVHIGGAVVLPPSTSARIVVQASESIAAALQRAESGSQVVVEPGEYRERLALRSGVMVVSRVPGGATLRLPGGAADDDAAVTADGVSGAWLIGFRIVGDIATPLGTGVLATDSEVSIIDVDISGATHAAVAARNRARLNLVGSRVQNNPGAALALGSRSSPRIVHNLFAHNGTSDRTPAAMMIDPGVNAEFSGNVFQGVSRGVFAGLADAARARLAQQNVFIEASDPGPPSDVLPRSGRGR